MSAILIDLDHFKQINDTSGTSAATRCSPPSARCMRTELRGSDFAGRSGGEEFVVMLPDTDRAGALRVAEKLRLAMHSLSRPGRRPRDDRQLRRRQLPRRRARRRRR